MAFCFFQRLTPDFQSGDYYASHPSTTPDFSPVKPLFLSISQIINTRELKPRRGEIKKLSVSNGSFVTNSAVKERSIAVLFSELLMNRNVEQGFSRIKYFLNTVLSCGIVIPLPLAGFLRLYQVFQFSIFIKK